MNLLALLYNDGHTIDPTIVLRDIDIDIGTTDADITIITAIIRNDHRVIERKTMVNFGIKKAIHICDKLQVTSAINNIIALNIGLKRPIAIINHTLCNGDVIVAYGEKYRVLHNGIVATRDSEMYARSMGKILVCDADILKFSRIVELNADSNVAITTCAPFAKFLRKLSARIFCGICDDGLRSCVLLEQLDAGGNKRITTCDPFATSLRALNAESNIVIAFLGERSVTPTYNCGITDEGLTKCKNLTSLNSTCNLTITNYKPFSKSLRMLYVERFWRQGQNKNLEICNAIEKFYACDNDDITTCEPFAHTLRVLHAELSCTISDSGIKKCYNIEKLYADDNANITTCAPFAHSLRTLFARNTCGITDNGLKLCINIRILCADDNIKITTCAPFAASLRALSASAIRGNRKCGITDAGLLRCAYLEELNASCNSNIITCGPFSRTLRKLDASGQKCGITNKEIDRCTALKALRAQDNAKISKCKYIRGLPNK